VAHLCAEHAHKPGRACVVDMIRPVCSTLAAVPGIFTEFFEPHMPFSLISCTITP
jgi:hypothetical protein